MTGCVFFKNQDEIPKEIIYCRGAKSPQEVFTTGFPSKVYMGHFYEKHKGSSEINDINLYIMRDSDNKQYIYQYCGNVTDCEDFIVPYTFYVKKVGMMIDLEDDVKIMYKISDDFKSFKQNPQEFKGYLLTLFSGYIEDAFIYYGEYEPYKSLTRFQTK